MQTNYLNFSKIIVKHFFGEIIIFTWGDCFLCLYQHLDQLIYIRREGGGTQQIHKFLVGYKLQVYNSAVAVAV